MKTTATKVTTRTIEMHSRSGSFSARAEYTPTNDNMVQVDDWTYDSLGIVPNGVQSRWLPLEEAQTEYRERKANGWT